MTDPFNLTEDDAKKQAAAAMRRLRERLADLAPVIAYVFRSDESRFLHKNGRFVDMNAIVREVMAEHPLLVAAIVCSAMEIDAATKGERFEEVQP